MVLWLRTKFLRGSRHTKWHVSGATSTFGNRVQADRRGRSQCLMKGAVSPACFFCCLIVFFSFGVCCGFFLLSFGG